MMRNLERRRKKMETDMEKADRLWDKIHSGEIQDKNKLKELQKEFSAIAKKILIYESKNNKHS